MALIAIFAFLGVIAFGLIVYQLIYMARNRKQHV